MTIPLPNIFKRKDGCVKLHEQVIEPIRFEISQIDKLLHVYRDILDRTDKEAPGLVECTAIASVLHSFYNGNENICLVIAKKFDKNVPEGSHWHASLLNQMRAATVHRQPVLSERSHDRIAEYLGFRHLFRHVYPFRMEWERLEEPVQSLAEVWREIKVELEMFLEFLNEDQEERT